MGVEGVAAEGVAVEAAMAEEAAMVAEEEIEVEVSFSLLSYIMLESLNSSKLCTCTKIS